RAALGTGVFAFLLLFAETGAWGLGILLTLTTVFALFAARTIIVHRTRVEMDDVGIAAFGLRRRAIPWSEVRDVALKYYSTRRDRRRGWMQMTVRGSGQSLKLDSKIDGFDRIVRRVGQAAAANDVELSEITAANLYAFEQDDDDDRSFN
ncbi:MAG: hypothetical protein RII27_09125, partial [Alphaproteobacteria bacterium]